MSLYLYELFFQSFHTVFTLSLCSRNLVIVALRRTWTR
jgi:hypothetical protein